MTVCPATVAALWSDGPAPPRRVGTPARWSATRTPLDCSSAISARVGADKGRVLLMEQRLRALARRVCVIARGYGNRLRGTLRLRLGTRYRAGDLGRSRVDQQTKQLGPRVVTDRVHHALALDDQTHVEVGHQEALAFAQRLAQMVAFGRDDRRHAAAAQRFLHAHVGADALDLIFGQPAGRVDDEAARLECVMPQGDLQLVGKDTTDHGARELRAVDLFVLRHQRVARERVVVLPASERADLGERSVDDLEAAGVALAPDHALVKGRRELATLEQDAAIFAEDDLRVVERAMIALVDAEHHDDAVP